MKTILENFLDALDISYTKRFTRNMFQEHPHKNNMYGLKKMLDVYGVKTMGVYVDTKDLLELNYPCILHIHGDFVIGLDCKANTVSSCNMVRKRHCLMTFSGRLGQAMP